MKWIIQKNYNKNLDKWLAALQNQKVDFTLIEVIPFSDALPEIAVSGTAIAFGTTTLMKHAQKQWSPGVFFNSDNFKFSLWIEKFKENLFNSDGFICSLKEVPLHPQCPLEFFIRPNNDFKDFTGMKVQKESLKAQIQNIESHPQKFAFNSSLEVFVAPLKFINQEFRFFIVDGKVITGCQYRVGNLASFKEDIPDSVWTFAQEMASLWTPERACVMDIAVGEKGPKVLEFNCFNASSVYVCDVEKIIQAVQKMNFK